MKQVILTIILGFSVPFSSFSHEPRTVEQKKEDKALEKFVFQIYEKEGISEEISFNSSSISKIIIKGPLTCTNLGSLDCLMGYCLAETESSIQESPGTSLSLISITNYDNCKSENIKIKSVPLSFWD